MSEKRKRSMDGVRPVKKANLSSQPSLSKSAPVPSKARAKDSVQERKYTPTQKKTISYTASSPKRSFLQVVRDNWFWLNYVVKIGVVLLVVVFLANRNAHTKVAVTPHIEYMELQDEITAYANPKEGELGFDIIAVTDEVSIPIEAAGTRPLSKKATGNITIYNNYSSEPQRLLPETRFESASGKIFKIGNEEVIIPGKEGEAPGTIEVEVTADQAGPEYNIDITDFSIPGFKDLGLEEKYKGIYGVSAERFNGGIISTEGYIEENQRVQAEQALQDQLSERLELRLLKENTDKVLIIGNSAEVRFKDSEFVSDENEQNGLLTQKGTIVALALSKESLDDYLVVRYLNLPEDEIADIIDNQNIRVSLKESSIDYNNVRSTQLAIEGRALVEWQVDPETLGQQLQGINKSALPSVLREINSIDTAKIDIFPPWKKNVSHTVDEIEIQVD